MNILIVDDESITLKEIEHYMTEYSEACECVKCKNAFEALERAQDTKFDIGLLDIEMPEMNGIELAEKLFQINSKIKIVFVTAYNNYAAEAFEVNAVYYILKPIRRERLYKTLDKLCPKITDKVNTADKKQEMHIQTFGRLTVKCGENVLKWSRQKSSEIFAYLLMNNNKMVHKDKLCDELWPETSPQKALANLQTGIWQLRKTLSVFGEEQILIKYTNNCYKLTYNNGYYDADEFVSSCYKAFKENSENLLEKAFKIYQGRYLEEEDWFWAASQREALDVKYKMVVENLIKRCIQLNNSDKTLEYLKKFIECWPEDDAITEKYIPLLRKFYGDNKIAEWLEKLRIEN